MGQAALTAVAYGTNWIISRHCYFRLCEWLYKSVTQPANAPPCAGTYVGRIGVGSTIHEKWDCQQLYLRGKIGIPKLSPRDGVPTRVPQTATAAAAGE